VVLISAGAAWSYEGNRSFRSGVSAARTALDRLAAEGVDPAVVAALRSRLVTIDLQRGGPLSLAAVPAPLGRAQSQLDQLSADVRQVELRARDRERLAASGALTQLVAADPSLPAPTQAIYAAAIAHNTTLRGLIDLTTAIQAQALEAANLRKPATDLASSAAQLQQMVDRSMAMGIDIGEARDSLTAYANLVQMPTSEISDAAGRVKDSLDKAISAQSDALALTPVIIDKPTPLLCLPGMSGRLITVNLTTQHLDAYQDGCLHISTPVTTGMEFMRTEPGTYHIIFKQAPYQFISPWPPGDWRFYNPLWANWAMKISDDGIFIHDAPWQAPATYGPGSEDGPYSSHGCVHTPPAVMPTVFSWAQPGDPVVISDNPQPSQVS
jgi:lipoprotein-anchoring transpeptidase ErfK/SrfK